eukprot:Skav234687  [mRNA]  locus=scaffold3643:102118:105230:+ [translate_table: standard]
MRQHLAIDEPPCGPLHFDPLVQRIWPALPHSVHPKGVQPKNFGDQAGQHIRSVQILHIHDVYRDAKLLPSCIHHTKNGGTSNNAKTSLFMALLLHCKSVMSKHCHPLHAAFIQTHRLQQVKQKLVHCRLLGNDIRRAIALRRV